MAVSERRFLPREGLETLVALLRDDGYTVVGPVAADGVIRLRELTSAGQLPRGVRDEQGPASYRLVDGDRALWFEHVVGPDGPKRFLFPPRLELMQFEARDGRFELTAGPPQTPKLALLGVRPCELAAIQVQDRVFAYGDPSTFRCESEPWYRQVRDTTVLIVVNCTRPGGTCFCDSWGTGPEARDGFDLSLTELRDGFVLRAGSERGRALAEGLPLRDPSGAELELEELKLQRACEHMGRRLETAGLKEALDQAVEHPQWDDVARRCLSCGNCTMVCPTCFCSTVTDATAPGDSRITRTRTWESCFTQQFSYTTGGPGRNTIRGRYRHWLRHKLCTWVDQFGVSGCVGCGRCITWCPVGIDLTEEAKRIRESLEPAGARTEEP